MGDGKGNRSVTLRGFNEGEVHRIEDDLPLGEPPHGNAQGFPELEVVADRGGPELIRGNWSAFMIWTQRRIYCLDGSLQCGAVLDRASFMPVLNHPVLACRLAYGQKRDPEGNIVQVTRPLPEVGCLAVFSAQVGNRVRWSETSPVVRVVLRQQRVDISVTRV